MKIDWKIVTKTSDKKNNHCSPQKQVLWSFVQYEHMGELLPLTHKYTHDFAPETISVQLKMLQTIQLNPVNRKLQIGMAN